MEKIKTTKHIELMAKGMADVKKRLSKTGEVDGLLKKMRQKFKDIKEEVKDAG